MAEGRHRQEHEEKDYVIAFKSGNKLVAEQLLPRIPQPAAITTTFEFSYYPVVALVSLLHLAAYWGWRNVVTALVSVYKCAANCKDEEGHIPLHYAAYNGHLEVVKYFRPRQVVSRFLVTARTKSVKSEVWPLFVLRMRSQFLRPFSRIINENLRIMHVFCACSLGYWTLRRSCKRERQAEVLARDLATYVYYTRRAQGGSDKITCAKNC